MDVSTLARAAGALLLDLLAPPTCAACDAPATARALFCAPCASTVVRRGPDAPRSVPLPVHAPFLYGGAIAAALWRTKYRARSDLAPRIGALLGGTLVDAAARRGVSLVVPVPSHPGRLAARGYDHASGIAGAVARALDLPRGAAVLRRIRDTPQQVGLSREARDANVRGAFACGAPARVRGASVLLVDDVLTTGATLAACAAALRDAGAADVRAAVVAHRA